MKTLVNVHRRLTVSKTTPPKSKAPKKDTFNKGYNPPRYEQERPKAPPPPPPKKDK